MARDYGKPFFMKTQPVKSEKKVTDKEEIKTVPSLRIFVFVSIRVRTKFQFVNNIFDHPRKEISLPSADLNLFYPPHRALIHSNQDSKKFRRLFLK